MDKKKIRIASQITIQNLIIYTNCTCTGHSIIFQEIEANCVSQQFILHHNRRKSYEVIDWLRNWEETSDSPSTLVTIAAAFGVGEDEGRVGQKCAIGIFDFFERVLILAVRVAWIDGPDLFLRAHAQKCGLGIYYATCDHWFCLFI